MTDIRRMAKEMFEAQRDKVLSRLPDEYKRQFGQLGFHDTQHPVLIVSPYDVPPGPVRSMWMHQFEAVRIES